jgi:tetratricopeptide (TPR) repeat protein
VGQRFSEAGALATLPCRDLANVALPVRLANVALPLYPAGSLVIAKGSKMVPDTYEVLRRNLSSARQMLARGHLSLWLLRAITLVAAILLLSTALVLLVGTDSLATAVLGVLVVFGLPLLVLSAIVTPLLRIPTVESVAVMADRLEGEKNTLISSLQLGRRMDELSSFYSKAIIEAIVGEGEALSKIVDFRRLLPARKLRSWSIACVLATLSLVAFLAFVPGAYEPSFSSMVSHPFEERLSISVKPGDIEIEPGETVRVRVIVKGSLSEPKLRVKSGSGPWNYIALVRASEPAGAAEASVFDGAIGNIEMSTQYAAVLGRMQTPVYKISVRTPPEVSEFLIGYEFPEYAGVEKRVVRSVVGDVSALRGTRVWLETAFSGEVSSAGLLFDDGKAVPMETRSDRNLTASFSLARSGTYRVSTTDALGGRYLSASYEINCQEDLAPFIKLVSPSSEFDIDESMELPLEVVCADDYGLTRLLLHYYKDPQDVRSEEIKSFKTRTKEAGVAHSWDLGSLQLLPGETVSYFLEVFDNDVISGPKSARTPLMTARFPTLAQLYGGMEGQQDERIVDLKQILDEAQTVREELEKVSRELKQESGLSWERKKEVENLEKANANIAENIDRFTQALEADAEKLQSYDPTNLELAQKILEIKKLLEAIKSPELKSAIEKFQEALSKLDMSQMEKALTEYAIPQEELLKGLDRAIELLKQIQLEEKLRAATEKAAELAQKQGEVGQKLDEKEPDFSKASEEQSDIGKSLEKLKEELEQIAKEAQNKELSRMLEEVSNSIGKAGLQDEISKSAEMLRSRQTAGLRRLLHKIEGSLHEVVDQLTRVQQDYSSNQLADVTEKVRRAMHELVRLSKEQEELSMSPGRESAQDLAMRQQGILEGTSNVADRLFEISKGTFFMNQGTSSNLGTTLRKMEKALRSFEANVKGDGLWTGREAYQSLNGVLASLLLAEQSMCSGQGAGMGIGQGFQRMRSLGGLQQGINRATEDLYSAMSKQGRLSHSEEETLGRLAAQQEMVRKGMEEVSRALGQRRDILGRLDEIIDDMKNVEEQMSTKQLDQDVVQRQNHILSRLLDAQKSVQQQDYTGKRYSRPGKDFPDRRSPPELPRELLGRSEKIRLDMLRGKADRYPESYRELVEQYMRALSGSTK